MKKCPVCDKEFPDSMRFCQTDGTPLVENEPIDPYKTVIGRQEDIAAAIPPGDPFKTVAGGGIGRKDDSGDLLQLPEEFDPLKTMYASESEIRNEMNTGKDADNSVIEVPPVAAENSTPQSFPPPSPPVFSEPNITPPSFSDAPPAESKTPVVQNSFSEPEKTPEPIANPFEQSGQTDQKTEIINTSFTDAPKPLSPFDNAPNSAFDSSPFGRNSNTGPIPSPFNASMPPGYLPPSAPLPAYKEPEKLVSTPGYEEPEAAPTFNNNPFDNQPPMGSAPLTNQSSEPNWMPPPAPDSNWQNQQIGQNTPFQPPVASASVNQTLPIISLVLGIVSICCYISPLTGIAALITGYLGLKNVNNNPSQYGGKGLAIAGMIVGGIFFLLGIIYYILIFLGIAANLATMPR